MNSLGVLIVTHGGLGKGILNTAQMFIGNANNLEYISLNEGEDLDKFKQNVQNLVYEYTARGEVLCMVDIESGTPARVISEIAIHNSKVHIISGVNLPLLIEALILRDQSISSEEIIKQIIKSGKEGIVDIGSKLKEIRNQT